MGAVERESAIKVGDTWRQVAVWPDGRKRQRVIEVIGRPTLSSPVNYRILRNDSHPHRVGKTGSIRQSELRRKYRPVS